MENKISNKFSMGKFLRNKKKLKKRDLQGTPLTISKKFEEYFSFLKKKGVEINKVGIGQFKTKNGLPYSGIYAKETIFSNEDLIRVPRELLLTTRSAYFSEIRFIFTENPEFYSSKFNSSWEDNMLLTYILFEYQKKRESIWYHLIENLPKEIDYLIFWSDEELKLLDDPILVKIAKQSYEEFLNDYQETKNILSKYPTVFKTETFSFENYKWFFTNIVTRCFGKYLNNITMVPLIEMFNHECSDVYYDFDYNEYSKEKPAYDKNSKRISIEEEENFSTSNESYNSEDNISESEFEYNVLIKKPSIFEVKEISDKEIKNIINDIYIWVYSYLDLGDYLTPFYLAKIYQEIQEIEMNYFNKAKSYFQIKKELNLIQTQNSNFKKEIIKYYKGYLKESTYGIELSQKKNMLDKMKEEKKKGNKPKARFLTRIPEFKPDSQWKEDNFDYFVMRTSSKDQFEKHSQVFFCYGRLSNRMMLMRYGMAIDFNKYDHVYLRISYFKVLNPYPKILEQIKSSQISKFKRFKIKYTTFNFEIVNFFKSQSWDLKINSLDSLFFIDELNLEILALNNVKNYYEEEFMKKSIFSIEKNKNMLTNKTLNYHEHFAVIYRLGRQRIIQLQINLVKICLELLKRLKNKKLTFENVFNFRITELETTEEFERNRYLLNPYFKRLNKGYK